MCKKFKIRYHYYLDNYNLYNLEYQDNNKPAPTLTYKMVSTILVVSVIGAIGVCIYRKL